MLVLVTVRGLSYEAAAAICGCEVGTAKSRVHRGRAALRAMLLDQEMPARRWVISAKRAVRESERRLRSTGQAAHHS